jgi:hypothetical protein
LLIVVALSATSYGIFSKQDKSDPLAQSIREISNTYPFDKEKSSKLIEELINKQEHTNLTNLVSKIELK